MLRRQRPQTLFRCRLRGQGCGEPIYALSALAALVYRSPILILQPPQFLVKLLRQRCARRQLLRILFARRFELLLCPPSCSALGVKPGFRQLRPARRILCTRLGGLAACGGPAPSHCRPSAEWPPLAPWPPPALLTSALANPCIRPNAHHAPAPGVCAPPRTYSCATAARPSRSAALRAPLRFAPPAPAAAGLRLALSPAALAWRPSLSPHPPSLFASPPTLQQRVRPELLFDSPTTDCSSHAPLPARLRSAAAPGAAFPARLSSAPQAKPAPPAPRHPAPPSRGPYRAAHLPADATPPSSRAEIRAKQPAA
eukprot:7381453-Prymnesium_polylepis.2